MYVNNTTLHLSGSVDMQGTHKTNDVMHCPYKRHNRKIYHAMLDMSSQSYQHQLLCFFK